MWQVRKSIVVLRERLYLFIYFPGISLCGSLLRIFLPHPTGSPIPTVLCQQPHASLDPYTVQENPIKPGKELYNLFVLHPLKQIVCH